MTVEERFTKIENFLMTVAEHQAGHEARLIAQQTQSEQEFRELRALHTTVGLAIKSLAEAQERSEEQLEALAEAQQRTAEAQQRTEDLQQHTEQKLNALIETVDRIIRRDGPDA